MPTVPSLDVTPLYALAGAGDLAVVELRKRAGELQAQVRTLPNAVRELPAELPGALSDVQTSLIRQAAVVQQRVRSLPTRFQDLPVLVQELPAQAVKQVRSAAEEWSGKAASSYSEWAKRGEQVVAGLRGDTSASVPAAKTTATTTKSAAKTVGQKTATGAAKAPKAAKPAVKSAAQAVAETAPVVTEPVVSAPVVTEPAVSEPTVSEAPVTAPELTLPDTDGGGFSTGSPAGSPA